MMLWEWEEHPLSRRKEQGRFCKKFGHMSSIQKSRHRKQRFKGPVVREKRGCLSMVWKAEFGGKEGTEVEVGGVGAMGRLQLAKKCEARGKVGLEDLVTHGAIECRLGLRLINHVAGREPCRGTQVTDDPVGIHGGSFPESAQPRGSVPLPSSPTVPPMAQPYQQLWRLHFRGRA